MDQSETEDWGRLLEASEKVEPVTFQVQTDKDIQKRIEEYNAWVQSYQAAVGKERSKIVKLPPSEERMMAMVKRLHLALNTDEEIEAMYTGELIESVKKMDDGSRVKFVELFNARGGRVMLS